MAPRSMSLIFFTNFKVRYAITGIRIPRTIVAIAGAAKLESEVPFRACPPLSPIPKSKKIEII